MFNLAKPFYPLADRAVKGNPEDAHRQLLKTLSWLDRSRHSFLGKRYFEATRAIFLLPLTPA